MTCRSRYVSDDVLCGVQAHWMVTTACVHEHMRTMERCKVCTAGAEIGMMLCRDCLIYGITTHVNVMSKQPLTLEVR